MRWLLDTHILIAALKGRPGVRERLEAVPASALVLSPVVLGELEFGVEKSAWPERNREALAAVVSALTVEPLDAVTARTYAHIRAALERAGTPIGANDLWIAAQAVATGATLVSDNQREFSRVPGLRVDNWLIS